MSVNPYYPSPIVGPPHSAHSWTAPPAPFLPNDPPHDYPVADLSEDDLIHEYTRVKPLADHYAAELERIEPMAEKYSARLGEVLAELKKRLTPPTASPMPWDTDFPRRVLKDNPQA